MDVFEQLENLWVSGLHHQIPILLEKNKQIIYPPDYHQYNITMLKNKKGSKQVEKWRQSIGEKDVIQSLFYKIFFDIDEIYGKVGYILNSPPKNADQLRDEISKIIRDKITLFDKILEEINNFEKPLTNEDGFIYFDWSKPIWINYIKVRQSDLLAMYHFVLIQPDNMILAAVNCVDLCSGDLENSILKAGRLSNLMIYYRLVNDMDKNREICMLLLVWLEDFIKINGHAPKLIDNSIDNNLLQAYSGLGFLNMIEGNLIKAEKYLQKNLLYSQSGLAHIILAGFYIDFGDLEKAEYHLEKSINIGNQRPSDIIDAQYHIHKAKIQNLKGVSSTSEINSALDLIKEYLKKNNFITSEFSILTYFRLADIYMANSELIEAKKYYTMVSDMCQIVQYFDFQRAECLMKLIQISCIEGKDTELLRNELYGIIAEFSGHEKMTLYKDLSEAIILKHMTGVQKGKSRFRAQEVFEKISRGKIYDIKLHLFARFNYCELLLDDFQFYGEEEILDVLVNEVEDLTAMSKEKGLILYYIEVLILRSKIATLQKDLESSINYLEEAQTLADERNLKMYQERIKLEKKIYLQNLDSWDSMRKDDKIEKLKLKQYLKFAQQNITK
ncbi:MAG: hypothetical protein GPJ54_12615 [Candidatus Heimdallarchaeota archaeon]|nr:hypothetical protein [Candidatus Heimdallarchaeota archaeon]